MKVHIQVRLDGKEAGFDKSDVPLRKFESIGDDTG